MITILHGDDIASSRLHLSKLKEKLNNPLILNGQVATITDVVQELEGGGLFNDKKAIIIENLLSQKKNSEQEDIKNYILKNPTSEIILWETKELATKDLSAFKKASIVSFKFPQLIFQFIDSIKPNNANSMIRLFHKALSTTNEELLFFMLIRQIRILLALSDSSLVTIDELNRLAPWQRGKLLKQAQSFSLTILKKVYKDLFKIETELKTGGLSQPLSSTIDIFLLSL